MRVELHTDDHWPQSPPGTTYAHVITDKPNWDLRDLAVYYFAPDTLRSAHRNHRYILIIEGDPRISRGITAEKIARAKQIVEDLRNEEIRKYENLR